MFLMKDILNTHLPFFTTTFAVMVIPHKYSAEMAKKSYVAICTELMFRLIFIKLGFML